LALGSTHELQSKADIERAADNVRLRLESPGTGSRVTLERFAEFWFLRVADGRLRQSTAKDDRWRRFNKYIIRTPRGEVAAEGIPDARRSEDGIASNHPKLAKASLQRIKALLSGIFRHAVVAGFRGNPVRDVFLPGRMTSGTDESKRPPGVYELNTVWLVLKQLPPDDLRAAVAVAAFAGLRLAELQGLTWDDYDGDSLTVRRTRWQGYENAPKSKASAAAVPVVPELRAVLDEYQQQWAKLPPLKPIINEDAVAREDRSLFHSPLVAYGRYHLPAAFGAVKSEWRGWRAFRRGLASTLFETGAEDLVVQRILRHARVIVTRESYIKRIDIRVTEAMGKIGSGS
jgi:integrase